jgi:hypothetical protein
MFKKELMPEFMSELFGLSDRLFSAKLVPTIEDRGCHVVSVTHLYGRILDFRFVLRHEKFSDKVKKYHVCLEHVVPVEETKNTEEISVGKPES